MKTCCRCGESLPLDSFGRDATRADGRRSDCKHCRRVYEMGRRQAYRATGLPADSDRHGTVQGYQRWGCRCEPCTAAGVANVRAWRQSARATGLPADSDRHGTPSGYNAWGCRCEPCIAANTEAYRAWRQAARARGLPADSDWHGTPNGYSTWGCRCEPCTAAGVARASAWRQAARARGLPAEAIQHGTRGGYDSWGCRCEPCTAANAESYRAWRETHPDAARAIKRRRRARKAGVTSAPYIDVDIIARDRKAGGCYLCHRPLPDDRQAIHLDHRVPLVRGGADTPDNVFAVHATCNLTKGTLSEDEARARILASV